MKADPTPQSPAEVYKNPEYGRVPPWTSTRDYWPTSAECVVRHKASDTFWRAVYAVRDDDSDFECGATWHQVVPKQVTTTTYEDV